ncbi:hypothetical protein [Nocardiopsis potens]|uniref:hypothetical protein n=1 Tax=Nocardiopsis potens TaxID=1246458 RepID=UPI000344A9CF|nr:hypothetical protein [Nocardiopsis potens]
MLAGAGGGAYYLGWFDPDNGYKKPLAVCSMVDQEAGNELSGNPDEMFENEWEIPGTPVTEYSCNFPVAYGDEEHNDADVAVLMHTTMNNGISRATGDRLAQEYFTNEMVEGNELKATACPSGREIYSGYDGGGTTRTAMAAALVENLAIEGTVAPAQYSDSGMAPEERRKAAEDLLCGALDNLPAKG